MRNGGCSEIRRSLMDRQVQLVRHRKCETMCMLTGTYRNARKTDRGARTCCLGNRHHYKHEPAVSSWYQTLDVRPKRAYVRVVFEFSLGVCAFKTYCSHMSAKLLSVGRSAYLRFRKGEIGGMLKALHIQGHAPLDIHSMT